MANKYEAYPLLMTEEYWANTQFSVVRHCGQIRIDGREYIIVDKHGNDIFELSRKPGDGMAIPPGEPADLVLKCLVRPYKTLGRDLLIEKIKEGLGEKEIIAFAKKHGKEKTAR